MRPELRSRANCEILICTAPCHTSVFSITTPTDGCLLTCSGIVQPSPLPTSGATVQAAVDTLVAPDTTVGQHQPGPPITAVPPVHGDLPPSSIAVPDALAHSIYTQHYPPPAHGIHRYPQPAANILNTSPLPLPYQHPSPRPPLYEKLQPGFSA